MTSIGDYAFEYCNDLKTIKYRGTQEQWSQISKGASWDGDSYGIIIPGGVGSSGSINKRYTIIYEYVE